MKKLIALALSCLMLLSACGGGSSAETSGDDGGTPTYKDTITWAQAADVTSLDPHVGKESVAVTVNTQIFSTLMRVTGDGDPQPSLPKATSSWTTPAGSSPSGRESSSTTAPR